MRTKKEKLIVFNGFIKFNVDTYYSINEIAKLQLMGGSCADTYIVFKDGNKLLVEKPIIGVISQLKQL